MADSPQSADPAPAEGSLSETDDLRRELRETRIALNVPLNSRSDYLSLIRKNVRFTVDRLVRPYLDKLRETGLDSRQRELVDLIDRNLDSLASPELQSAAEVLTPMELKVANLIRIGKSNKDIARILDRSVNTVQSHRYNLRRKLGLNNRKINLRSYLHSNTVGDAKL